jgi:hypothetical protein
MARFGEIVLWMITTSAKLRKKQALPCQKWFFMKMLIMVARRKLFIFQKTKPVFPFGAKLSTLVKKIEIFSQTLCIWTTFETTKIWK